MLHALVTSQSNNYVEGRPVRQPKTYINKVVSRELSNASILRNQLKDVNSSKLNVQAPKQADALRHADLLVLRSQLSAFTEDLNEIARKNYLLNQNNEKKNIQDNQCAILLHLHKLLRKKLIDDGDDTRKYRIGGTEKSTYERFFKVEPKRVMSKAQLITALRYTFGSELVKSEGIINQIFHSFDFHSNDQMDWRAFLYMIMILMQPELTCQQMFQHAFALYCSVGSFDLQCTEKISLGTIRNMICIPVQLSYVPMVQQAFDEAWDMLLQNDNEILQYVAKRQQSCNKNGGLDPHDILISYSMFQKLLMNTSLYHWLLPGLIYGKCDTRMWLSFFEEQYYHPIIVHHLKDIRRYYRNEDMKTQFIAEQQYRYKKYTINNWKIYTSKRQELRWILIGVELRSELSNYSMYINHWRTITMEFRAIRNIQRIIRGYLARKRKYFIVRLQSKVKIIQSHTRQLLSYQKYRSKKLKLTYAAITIQRHFRGKLARYRIASMIESMADTRRRLLLKARKNWELQRQIKACIAIQMMIRRFIRRKHIIKRLKERELREEVEAQIIYTKRIQEREEELYKQSLSQWYITRKTKYDEVHYHAKQSSEHQKILLRKKHNQKQEIMNQKKILQELQVNRMEEEKISRWLSSWEKEIVSRGELYRKKLQSCLIMPETPEEIVLKKEIITKIKANLKEVLRRADKAKIPMEIPEGYEISTKEVIEMEVENVMNQARLDMKNEATKLQQEQATKEKQEKDKQKESRQRNKIFSVLLIQQFMRRTLARKQLHSFAMKRYQKHFHREYHEYYYQDNVTKFMFWQKPKTLGEYDVDMDDVWVVMFGKTRDNVLRKELDYYYNPSTWQQTWVLPTGTIVCDICNEEFAKCYYPYYSINILKAIRPGVIAPLLLPRPFTADANEINDTTATTTSTIATTAVAVLSDEEHHPYANETANTTNTNAQAEYHYTSCYCLSCFEYIVLSDLFSVTSYDQTMTIKDVYIRLFEGGSPLATNLDLDTLPSITWYNYLMTQQDQKKLKILMNEDEENEFLKQEEATAATKKKQYFVTCQNCFRYPTCVYCQDCQLTYCITCNEKEHPKRNPKRYAHIRIDATPDDDAMISQTQGPPLEGQGIPQYEYPPNYLAYDSDEEEDHRQQQQEYEDTQAKAARKAAKKAKKKQVKHDDKHKEKKKKKKHKHHKTNDGYASETPSQSTATTANTKERKQKKKKHHKKAATSETESEFTATGSEYEDNKSKTSKGSKSSAHKKTKKKKKKHTDEEDASEERKKHKTEDDSSDTKASEHKKKNKNSKAGKDHHEGIDGYETATSDITHDSKHNKDKKKKKKKSKMKENNEGIDAAELALSPTKEKKTKKAKKSNEIDKSDGIHLPPIHNSNHYLQESPRNHLDESTGDTDDDKERDPNHHHQQHRPNSTPSDLFSARPSNHDEEESASDVSSTTSDQQGKEKKKKKKKQKAKENKPSRSKSAPSGSQSIGDEPGFLPPINNSNGVGRPLDPIPEKKKKKHKKDKTTDEASGGETLGTASTTKKKKKKKKENEGSLLLEDESLSRPSTTNKKDKKKKKKSKDGLSNTGNSEVSSLSEYYSSYPDSSPEKQKKKKKKKKKNHSDDDDAPKKVKKSKVVSRSIASVIEDF